MPDYADTCEVSVSVESLGGNSLILLDFIDGLMCIEFSDVIFWERGSDSLDEFMFVCNFT
jgi:hypothetical protein